MSFACVFPGQGSQSVGMLAALASSYPAVVDSFAEASDVVEKDLWKLCQNGPQAALSKTETTQPLMLTAGVAVWRVWRETGGAEPAVAAGHSLGEYSALVAAGAMLFSEAVSLVAARGRFMQDAVPFGEGAMAAVLGLPETELAEVCQQATQSEQSAVSCANFNAPGQIVIAGHAHAVQRAMEIAAQRGAKRALPLPVSAPFHCALMRPASERLRGILDACAVQAPVFPITHNVDVQGKSDASEIRDALLRQVDAPVQWTATIESFATQAVEQILEMGPGKVLTGLSKRIAKGVACLAVNDPKSLDAALEASQSDVIN